MGNQPVISRFFKPVNKSSLEKNESKASNISQSSDETIDSKSVSIDLEYEEEEVELELPSVENRRIVPSTNIMNKATFGEPLSENLSKKTDSDLFLKKLNKIMSDKKRSVDDVHLEEVGLGEESEHVIPKKSKTAKNDKLTPLDQQVKDLKMKNMDKILVVRVGYKYKCFAEDAVTVSQLLHIMLIPGKLSVDGSNPQDMNYKQFAYCSFPDMRLKVHLENLVHHNLKVAVVEQTETSAIKKNSNTSKQSSVFERKITGIYTKASFGVNSTFNHINQKFVLGHNNSIWIISLVPQENDQLFNFYIISVNLNSGEVIYDTFEDSLDQLEKFGTRIQHLNPVEVYPMQDLPKSITKKFNYSECSVLDRSENIDMANIPISEFQEIISIEKMDNNFSDLLYHLYNYLSEYNNQKILLLVTNYKNFLNKSTLTLDNNTIECLDIFANDCGKGSLFWLLDHTRTAFGSRQLREWVLHPLKNKEMIEARLKATNTLINEIESIFFDSLNNLLKNTPDILKTINRISYGMTSRKEIYYFLKQMKSFFDHFQLHKEYYQTQVINTSGVIGMHSKLLTSILTEINDNLFNSKIPELLSMINVAAVMDRDEKKQVTEFFNLNNYVNSENIIKVQRDISAIKEELQTELIGIRKFLKRPHLVYKDEIDYLIEVRNTQIKGIPSDWVVVNKTKMVSRYQTPSTKILIEKLVYHNDLLYQEAHSEYLNFVKSINEEYTKLHNIIINLGIYDSLLSLSATSNYTNYVRPNISETPQYIHAKNARNPIIESLDINYVPNDVSMSEKDGKLLIITGPNMGGKSSYIRQVALLVLLTQIGSYVPADSLTISIFDNIFTRIGAFDNLLQGQSTFKVEMQEINHILKNLTKDSLLLLDEVGRGTSTEDGHAISWALINYLITLPVCPLVLFTTHYSSLGKSINSSLVENYFMDYVERKIEGEAWTNVVFLYKLKKGLTDNSFGLNVARLAQIDSSIINKAFSAAELLRQENEISSDHYITYKMKNILSSTDEAPQKLQDLMTLSDVL